AAADPVGVVHADQGAKPPCGPELLGQPAASLLEQLRLGRAGAMPLPFVIPPLGWSDTEIDSDQTGELRNIVTSQQSQLLGRHVDQPGLAVALRQALGELCNGALVRTSGV